VIAFVLHDTRMETVDDAIDRSPLQIGPGVSNF